MPVCKGALFLVIKETVIRVYIIAYVRMKTLFPSILSQSLVFFVNFNVVISR